MKKTLTTLLSSCVLIAIGVGLNPAVATTLKHQNLSCTSCHKEGTQLPPDKNACLACHRLDDIVKSGEKFNFEFTFKKPKTGEVQTRLNRINPHDNFHFGQSDQCVNCHREHQPSTLTCQTCHDVEPWNMKPPR